MHNDVPTTLKWFALFDDIWQDDKIIRPQMSDMSVRIYRNQHDRLQKVIRSCNNCQCDHDVISDETRMLRIFHKKDSSPCDFEFSFRIIETYGVVISSYPLFHHVSVKGSLHRTRIRSYIINWSFRFGLVSKNKSYSGNYKRYQSWKRNKYELTKVYHPICTFVIWGYDRGF